MLLWFVILYIAVSVAIGLYAARRVKNTSDYVVAGHHLPLPFIIATVFATWFGSETVLGIPAKFLTEGFRGVVADPFGSSMCLILVGLFFARPLYRMNLLTIGDFYRARYNRAVELATSIYIVISYLGWVSAQITALGLVFSVLTSGAIEPWQGMAIGTAIVLVYTLAGGMFSVAFTDLFQMGVILAGMVYIATVVSGLAGGAGVVITHAANAGKFEFFPPLAARDIIAFVAAWITMGFGSIPQQDVFQRVSAARDEKTAGRGSVLGGCLYFCFAFIPMFLAYSATLIDPALVARHIGNDSQYILPNLILAHTPLFAQIIFFGALLAAIMSCSSATLLAPSVTFAENVLKPFLPKLADWQFLRILRFIVFLFALAVLAFAISSGATIYGMVESAYKVTLVAAFTPLAFGLYWKRATTQGAACAIACGLAVWITCEILIAQQVLPAEPFLPPQFAGWLASLAGMLAGSLLPQWYGAVKPHRPQAATAKRGRPARDPACVKTVATTASPPWYAGFRIAVFALLASNTAYYLYAGTLAKGLDAAGWLALFVLYALETAGRGSLRAPGAAAILRAVRLIAAAAVCAAGIGYVIEGDSLDAINSSLWIAIVVVLEFELRRPQQVAHHRAWFTATAATLYMGLAVLVVAWGWRGAWMDAYDALLWLSAFATIEMDVLNVTRQTAAA